MKCKLLSRYTAQESIFSDGMLTMTSGFSQPEERSSFVVLWCDSRYFCIFC